MVNKAKKQGTTYETNIVNRLNKNTNFKAQRLAEGGSLDKGDIELILDNEIVYYLEAKSRQLTKTHLLSGLLMARLPSKQREVALIAYCYQFRLMTALFLPIT